MTALLADPAPVIVGWSLLALVVGVAVVCVIAAWGPKPKTPRTESPPERNHRIDAEARAACAPPVVWSGGTTLPNYDANVAARWHD